MKINYFTLVKITDAQAQGTTFLLIPVQEKIVSSLIE